MSQARRLSGRKIAALAADGFEKWNSAAALTSVAAAALASPLRRRVSVKN